MKTPLTLLLSLILMFSVFIFPVNGASDIHGAGKITTQSTALNVRSSPSSSATVKTTLKRNSYVTLISEKNGYWYVEYGNNLYGYCHADYITVSSTKVNSVKTASGRLRVRSSASASATVKDYLSSGELVTVLSTSGSYKKILYNGTKTGYVHADYLTTNTQTNSYKAIKHSVPNYKQTDSRWANVTLGNSGQTIKKIGCATTALAMTESFRTGTSITPDKMAKKLSYTSGGAVYWPSNYNIVTSSSGYLQKIYDQLHKGKPVILGAKNSYGGQHYVVITGVKATSNLTTSAFYINDPGSSTRTTLNQFLAAYPNFYKMMWYVQ